MIKVNIPTIVEHRGVIVPGLGNRKGKRNANICDLSDNWGGSRKKKVGMALDPWAHPDTIQSKEALISHAVKVKEEQKMKNDSNDSLLVNHDGTAVSNDDSENSEVETFVVDLDENDLEEFSALTNSMDDGEVPAGVAV